MLALIFLVQVIPLSFAADNKYSSSDPLWMYQLKWNTQWEGIYHHNEIDEQCSLMVHSTASVTFTSEHISMDMRVSSNDNITVTFEEASVWNSSIHAAGHTNVEFVGLFIKDGYRYRFVGNVSSQEHNNLGTISLSPKVIPGRSNSSTSLRYGLAIGVPIVLAILLMIASVLILRWGIKKGYLRHVPWAYKHFTNPRRGQADLEMNNPSYNVGSEQTEVHI